MNSFEKNKASGKCRANDFNSKKLAEKLAKKEEEKKQETKDRQTRCCVDYGFSLEILFERDGLVLLRVKQCRYR